MIDYKRSANSTNVKGNRDIRLRDDRFTEKYVDRKEECARADAVLMFEKVY